MKIILLQDIPKVGSKNGIVDIRAGYANYLIASGCAMVGNVTNRKRLDEVIKQAAHRTQQEKGEALDLVEKLQGLELVLSVKTGKEQKIFGSISPLQVVHALQAHHIDIEPKQVNILTPIKEVGIHQVKLSLYQGVDTIVQLHVKSDTVA